LDPFSEHALVMDKSDELVIPQFARFFWSLSHALFVHVCLAPLLAGVRQQVELLISLDENTTFNSSEPLRLTCADGLTFSGPTLSDDGRLTPMDADTGQHELRTILSALPTLADSSDTSLCYEVTLTCYSYYH